MAQTDFRRLVAARSNVTSGPVLGRRNPACGNGAVEHGKRDHGVRHLGQALVAAGRAASAAKGPLGSPTSPQHGKALCSHRAIDDDQRRVEQNRPTPWPCTGAHAGCPATGVTTGVGVCADARQQSWLARRDLAPASGYSAGNACRSCTGACPRAEAAAASAGTGQATAEPVTAQQRMIARRLRHRLRHSRDMWNAARALLGQTITPTQLPFSSEAVRHGVTASNTGGVTQGSLCTEAYQTAL